MRWAGRGGAVPRGGPGAAGPPRAGEGGGGISEDPGEIFSPFCFSPCHGKVLVPFFPSPPPRGVSVPPCEQLLWGGLGPVLLSWEGLG